MSNEAKEDTQFEGEYIAARLSGDMQEIASVLSERLRQMDKRAREANKRADETEAENKRLRAALFEELDHIRHDVRWADGGRALERAMSREASVEAALSEAQP